MITTIVGSHNKKHYNIHAGLLKHYSSFFRRGLSAGWSEATTRTFTLTEDDPNIFQLFFHWIYSGKLYSTLTVDGQVPISFMDLCELFIFGDARGIPELCNVAIDTIFQKFANEWGYPTLVLQPVYDHTPESSKLRIFLADIAVQTYGFANLRQDPSAYPKEWQTDVIMRSRELKTWPGNIKPNFVKSKAMEICSEYHDHSDPHKV